MTAYAQDHALTIAVMGCRVNGPGETDDADLAAVLQRHGLRTGASVVGKTAHLDARDRRHLRLRSSRPDFDAVAAASAEMKQTMLAAGISVAMFTTASRPTRSNTLTAGPLRLL